MLRQGFDEFMNLVIDDAIEVKLPNKTEPQESRRRLGKPVSHNTYPLKLI